MADLNFKATSITIDRITSAISSDSAGNLIFTDLLNPSGITLSELLASINSFIESVSDFNGAVQLAMVDHTDATSSVHGISDTSVLTTAPNPFGTTNRLLKSSGTGRNLISTGITIDSNNNMSGVASLSASNIYMNNNVVITETQVANITSNLQSQINNKTDIGHNHISSDITDISIQDLQTSVITISSDVNIIETNISDMSASIIDLQNEPEAEFWGKITNSSPISLTGVGATYNATPNRYHYVNFTLGTAGTLNIPLASENIGNVIGIRLNTSSGPLTVNASGSDLLDGVSSIDMTKNGTLLLYGRTANVWHSIVKNVSPGIFTHVNAISSQSLSGYTTDIEYEQVISDDDLLWVSNNKFNPPSSGIYSINASVAINESYDGFSIGIYKNGNLVKWGQSIRSTYPGYIATVDACLKLLTTDYITFRCSYTSTKYVAEAAHNTVTIVRIAD